jgi:cystathionine gamma-synthase
LLRVLDIAGLAAIAKDNNALLVVDNTFATPYLQRPLDLGADLVTHSATKYLGGHSDVIGGALVAKSQEHADQIHYMQRAVGAVAAPFDSYLVLRGIRTLAVRMDRQCESAMTVARMLQDHPLVSSVSYPGLEKDPGHELATKQMRNYSGMVSFRHAGGAHEARRMAQRTKLFTLAESLGAVESLIEVPAAMTHAASSGSLLAVPDDLVRLSIGVEHVDDLLADLRTALDPS